MNPSGLSARHRVQARELAMQAAALGLSRAPSLHYTQGPQRWQGIHEHLKAWRGSCPTEADCSAFVTWCLWNGLDHFHHHDNVNGLNWKAGYTGTGLKHGASVKGHTLEHADVVYYGRGWPGEHEAIYIGGGLVISHGSEGGPYKLRLNYRPDLLDIRRYI